MSSVSVQPPTHPWACQVCCSPDACAVPAQNVVLLQLFLDSSRACIAAIAAHHKHHVDAPQVDLLHNLPACGAEQGENGGRSRTGTISNKRLGGGINAWENR